MKKKKIDWNDVKHYPEDSSDKLILGSLITDYFYDMMDKGYFQVSLNDILDHLGVQEKFIDRNNIVIYDTRKLSKLLANIPPSEAYDAVEREIKNKDFDNRENA